ncbi:hypothetical protein RHGRI_032202 [Rhododendron griersonianum]|uniref:ZF-HD dimerization-type domain-containing protein n=1 Tax=Rhododendron griersonianum TaxID=479676 RepID=A0AAV6IB00_9ERIC|nr:hypothetical protein RHGRI_032202 [Rhododendron griersonianum]
MYIVKNDDDGRRWATIAIYRECQRKHSGQTGHHVVDGCLEFLGYGDNHRSEVAFYCSKCGCNRNFHRKEEISILVEPTTVQMIHESATARPPPHCSAPSPPPRQVPIPEVHIGNGEAEQEETSEQKRKRTKFTEAQKEAMRGYAERLGWRLRGHNDHQLFQFCLEIEITLQNFKLWMRNNKRKYCVEPEESSASCRGL